VGAGPEGLSIRDVRPGDTPALVALFGEVFGAPLSEEAWHWKYFAAPGMAASQVAELDGEVVGHAGGRRHVYAHRGVPHVAFESGDLMARPDRRGRGIWSAAATALRRRRIEPEGLFGHGFASEYVTRIGGPILSYAAAARVHLLRRDTLDPPPGLARAVVVSDAPPLDWDRRWPRIEAGFSLVLRRDGAHLSWRYEQRPDRRYRFLDDPSTGALAVVQVGGEDAYLMELLAPDEDPAALGRLALAVEGVAAAEGAARLTAWFPAWSRTAAVLRSSCGYAGSDGEQVLTLGHATDGVTPEWFARHFFYSLGDWDVQ
jgi:GNAT superfamily N-acetyltransferase